MVQKIATTKFMTKSDLYIDSGGFQIANGGILSKDIPNFIDMYYNCLIANKDYFKYI